MKWNQQLSERRAQMLERAIKGEDIVSVAEDLAKKYNVSPRTLQNDWSRRDKWLPMLFDVQETGKINESLKARLRLIERECWTILENAENLNIKIRALKTVLDVVKTYSDLFKLEELQALAERVEAIEKHLGGEK